MMIPLALAVALAGPLPAVASLSKRDATESSSVGALRAAAPTDTPPVTPSVKIGPGSYAPIDGGEREPIEVAAFLLEVTPVTNASYLAFVVAHPEWRRSRVKPIFAERGYLASWTSDTSFGALDGAAPVVEVSWFAAQAYCAAQAKRLPTEAEWELAGAARTPEMIDQILRWYSARPSGALPKVGAGKPNAWGVHDMHTLVWEWVDDFTSSLAPADERGGEDPAFCGGAGAGKSDDAAAYAAFMRRAFRSSLEGAFALPTLGFRCAQDAQGLRPSRERRTR